MKLFICSAMGIAVDSDGKYDDATLYHELVCANSREEAIGHIYSVAREDLSESCDITAAAAQVEIAAVKNAIEKMAQMPESPELVSLGADAGEDE